ncbi:MAG: redox-sensing transcriptional repressor Rex [Caldilineales bacterium]|nr:redox-sensing transcriptional repressor Rex [Caldilineales bacterium]MCW5860131.1 redox-sensing transcriptional repressor Rex [Caldilineales bacterium]
MSRPIVPDIVVGRLPIYLRVLNHLIAEGRQITSSQELGDRLGISSAQIRKDLSHFGEFGKQGTGYNVAYLRDQLAEILNVDREWRMVLIGAGDLGHALAHYHRFADNGFQIVGVFDSDPAKIGSMLGAYRVHGMEDLEQVVRSQGVEIAIIAVPPAAAREVASALIGLGISSILNYAPITLTTPANVHVQYVDPVAQLQHMAYYSQEAGPPPGR